MAMLGLPRPGINSASLRPKPAADFSKSRSTLLLHNNDNPFLVGPPVEFDPSHAQSLIQEVISLRAALLIEVDKLGPLKAAEFQALRERLEIFKNDDRLDS